MACNFPYLVENPAPAGFSHIPVPCGKCYDCINRQVSQWAFRIEHEEQTADSSHFVTLTYDTDHVPISPKGFMTLDIQDLQKFFKRLRKAKKGSQKVIYFAVGEYGSKTYRPHYHIILLNSNEEEVKKAWQLGSIHLGSVTGASIAYTLKYMFKESKIPLHANDDRKKEFRTMSKGIGKGYLTPQMIRFHKQSWKKSFLMREKFKIALPRYYRERIYTEEERKEINKQFEKLINYNYDKSEENLAEDTAATTHNLTEYKRNESDYKLRKAKKKAQTRLDL